MNKFFAYLGIGLTLLSQFALAGLPPTTSKGLGDTTSPATFNFQFPAMKPTRSGITTKLLGGGIFDANTNLITNNSWEIDSSNWTASAGTYQRETAAGSIVPPGVGSASWDPAAANDTLTANDVVVTSNDGLSGQNGVLSCAVKTAATDLKLQVYDGTNVISPDATTDVVPSSSAGFVRYSVNFIFPASGTIKARFKAQSNSVIAYIDDCYLGKAEGFNAFNAIGLATSWIAYTPTVNGFGTVTNNDAKYRRVGDSLQVRGQFSAGTLAATTASIQLPSSMTIDNSKLPTAAALNTMVGSFLRHNASGSLSTSTVGPWVTSIDNSTTDRVFISASITAGSALNKEVGTGLGSNGQTFEYDFLVPISGWSGENAYRPDVSSVYWSGFHDGDCDGWTTSSTSYTDPSNDGSCTFTETQNKNFGTVASAGSKTPGITFTPSKSGVFWACAMTPGYNNTTAKTSAYKLTDGTNILATAASYTITSGTASTMIPLCGLLPVTGGVSTTLKIQFKTDSGGTAFIAANSGVHGVDWSLVDISTNIPAPLLTGSVTSNSSGTERIERAKVTCSSSSAILSQSGSWVSSVANISGNRCSATIASGIFSAAPTCTATIDFTGTATTIGVNMNVTSSTAFSIGCVSNVGATTSACTNNDFYIICMGPR